MKTQNFKCLNERAPQTIEQQDNWNTDRRNNKSSLSDNIKINLPLSSKILLIVTIALRKSLLGIFEVKQDEFQPNLKCTSSLF